MFIVSMAVKRAWLHCVWTASWRAGWMFARNSVSAARDASDSFGSKCSNTLRSVCSVWRMFGSRS